MTVPDRFVTILSVLASAGLLACTSPQPEPQTEFQAQEMPAAPSRPLVVNPPLPAPIVTEEPLGDVQIAGVLKTANSIQVEQARLALANAADDRVKKFASMIIDHHGQNDSDLEQLITKLGITAGSTVMSDKLATGSTLLVNKLNGEKGPTFDRDYIDAQVQEHAEVLRLMDERLIPSATNIELKGSLVQFRPRVEQHLREAQALQAALGR